MQKPTDQSRPKSLIVCCESDVISEMGSSVFSFLGRIFVSEELWAWLIAWEELRVWHGLSL